MDTVEVLTIGMIDNEPTVYQSTHDEGKATIRPSTMRITHTV